MVINGYGVAGGIKLNKTKVQQIQEDIISGKDCYFGYSHFHASNMADYTLMSSTISDMCQVYEIEESQAAEIVQALTHE
jgi:hypothetical protein